MNYVLGGFTTSFLHGGPWSFGICRHIPNLANHHDGQDAQRIWHVPRTNGNLEWNGRVIVVPHYHQLLWQLCKNFTTLQWRDIKALPEHSGENSAQLLSPALEPWVRQYIGSCNACAVF